MKIQAYPQLCRKPHGKLCSRTPLFLLGQLVLDPSERGQLNPHHCHESQCCHLLHWTKVQFLLHSHKPRDWTLKSTLSPCINTWGVPPPLWARHWGPLQLHEDHHPSLGPPHSLGPFPITLRFAGVWYQTVRREMTWVVTLLVLSQPPTAQSSFL